MFSQHFFSHVKMLLGLNQDLASRITCLAQGLIMVSPMRLKPGTPQSQVAHSTTEPRSGSMHTSVLCVYKKRKLWRVCMIVKAHLSLCWSHSDKLFRNIPL